VGGLKSSSMNSIRKEKLRGTQTINRNKKDAAEPKKSHKQLRSHIYNNSEKFNDNFKPPALIFETFRIYFANDCYEYIK
jgi:hypothetical protein